MKINSLIIFFILFTNLFLIKTEPLKCGEEQIENCQECDTSNLNECAQCKTNYFPLLDNILCIACDDPIYGQIGCKGHCNPESYSQTGFALCNECKTGFYNIEGLCHKCSTNSEGCAECTYEKEEGSEENKFKCTKCLSNEYKLNEESYCEKCAMDRCDSCHYPDGSSEPVCDECWPGYYVNQENKCSECKLIYITNGQCTICSDNENDEENSECICDYRYTKKDDNSCIPCPENCDYCQYDATKETTKCTGCAPGSYFNDDNTCTDCGEECAECYLDENKNPICLKCYSGKRAPNDPNKCFTCPENCEDCEYITESNEVKCTKCSYLYVMNPTTGECIYCSEETITGLDGCRECEYNPTSQSYECSYCSNDEYVFVANKHKCLSNKDIEKPGLYGCLESNYNEETEKYECTSCKDNDFGTYIPVITDKSCIEKGAEGLSIFCLEAEKIDDKYSCAKCDDNYLLVDNKDSGVKNCYEKIDDFSFCSEGTTENGVNKCTECVENAHLESDKCLCNSDSFNKDTYKCYKCTDNKEGNPGCTDTDGCTYNPGNDQLNCNNCKDGYYKYTTGQCFLCSNDLANCDKCHFDNTENQLMCDSCLKGIYALNENSKCELNDFDEYPDISPGCIISKEKLNEYKANKKCEICKYGYFKTKDEKCVYCRSEQYGGPACYECGYEENENGQETDNIICKKCYTNSYSHYYYNEIYNYDYNYDYYDPLVPIQEEPLISSKGKCYDCQLEFSENCHRCEFVKNEDGTEKLKCAVCKPSYYLSEEGKCVNYTGLIEVKSNCIGYNFSLTNLDLSYQYNYINIYNYNFYENNGKNNFAGFNYKDIKGTIKSTCISCDYGYILNENGQCDQVTFDQCSFISLMKDQGNLIESCKQFCSWYYESTLITIVIGDKNPSYLSLYDLDKSHLDYLTNEIGESNIPTVCLRKTGEGSQNYPSNLLNCREAYFFTFNKTYVCKDCLYDYYFDDKTKMCKKKENKDEYYYNNKEYFSCKIISNGTETFPIYFCHNYMTNSPLYFTYIKYENGQHEFKKAEGELEGCSQANADTTYANSKYDCTKCYLGYISYYSKFYNRYICQNMKTSITRTKQINMDSYKDIQDKMSAMDDGTCEKDYFFTPDKETCYKCDVEEGMPGCKGACNYSLKRNNIIECTSGCKSGYIESSEGVCSLCSSISKGCHECHYETSYPSDFTGIKRKRRFECDFCEDGYSKSSTGECLDCEDLGLDDCSRCEIDPKNSSHYICTQCMEKYFVDEKGECEICEKSEFKPINKNKCVDCDDASQGGISNCQYCTLNGTKPICNQCNDGYILLTNNNSCLEKKKNKELQKFDKCDSLTLDKSNKLVCSKCQEKYSLIDNECLYIPTLYDSLLQYFYQSNYLDVSKGKSSMTEFVKFAKNDYKYLKYINISACQEAENKGTKDNPLYSCTKCYEKNKKKKSYIPLIKITEENSQISYCLDPLDNDEIKNCTEATYKIKDGEEVFSCTKCIENQALAYNKLTDTYYCHEGQTIQKCLVLFCKACNPYDGYICNECIADYEINSASGSCVKKTEVVPAVTWKDIYRLNMNDEKVINNKVIKGPSLRMKGFTSSQINTGHAFIVYLTFKIKETMRNLEENEKTITMPAICEVVDGVDASTDDINMVEYVCIGNSTKNEDMSKYKLDNIEEKKEESKSGEIVESEIKSTNLNELMSSISEEKLENLETKTESEFTYEELYKIVTFTLNEEIDNIKANNFTFNINLEGILSKDINPVTIEKEFDIVEIDDKANCKFEVESNKKNAKLTCDLDVSNHKDIKTFSFKTSQVNTEKNEIYLSKINDITLTNSVEEKKEDPKSESGSGSESKSGAESEPGSESDSKPESKSESSILSISLFSFVLLFIMN